MRAPASARLSDRSWSSRAWEFISLSPLVFMCSDPDEDPKTSLISFTGYSRLCMLRIPRHWSWHLSGYKTWPLCGMSLGSGSRDRMHLEQSGRIS